MQNPGPSGNAGRGPRPGLLRGPRPGLLGGPRRIQYQEMNRVFTADNGLAATKRAHNLQSGQGQNSGGRLYNRFGEGHSEKVDSAHGRPNQSDRKHLGFMKLYGFLTNKDSYPDTVIMAIHRNLDEWEDLMNGKVGKTLNDDLFVIIVHLLGEKICEETILQINQNEIVRRAFGDGFSNKLRDLCAKMTQYGFNEPSRQNGSTAIEVDHSKTRILSNLRKLFSFVTLKMPTTAKDHVQSHILSVMGCITACISTDSNRSELEVLRNEFQDTFTIIGSLITKEEEKEAETKRFNKYGFTPLEEQMLHDMTPPDDFREISIIPSIEEILSADNTFLRTNKKRGAYINADHYLDVQFRLLREDFVRPLKRGILDFLKNRHNYLRKQKMPFGNVRIYPNVRITSVQLVRDSLTYSLKLTEDIYKRVKWEKSKRLLQGSLLVLTANNFQHAFFAVVARRDANELRKGEFGVTWEGLAPGLDRQDEEYLMVECEVYFEAYRHTLQILKELQLEKFPLSKFIVEGSTNVCAPKYLQETNNQINIFGNYISPLVGPWPNAKDLHLDETQFAAFHAALTTEFAIIQGPPGTGKTFLGLKIAEVLLENLDAWWNGFGPILVVCYTNHALDQFLEGILSIMKRLNPNKDPAMIRVGGRSKTASLDEYSLARRRIVASTLQKYGRDYSITKSIAFKRVRDLGYERAAIMNHIVGLSNPDGIIKLRCLGKSVYSQLEEEFPTVLLDLMKNREWFGISDHIFENNIFSEVHLLNIWFTFKREVFANAEPRYKPPTADNGDCSDDEEDYDLEELMENRIFDAVNLEAENLSTISYTNTFDYVPGTSVKEIEQQLIRNFEIPAIIDQNKNLFPPQKQAQKKQIRDESIILENRLKCLKLLFHEYRQGFLQLPPIESLLNPPVHSVQNARNPIAYFDNLSYAQKWALYFAVIERVRFLKTREVKGMEDSIIDAQKKLQEIQRQGDGQLLQQAKVVGMTTTGAAKYNDLLKMMKSKIVIVEEAAEVLESHIVTCISQHCQHLILIGDHQQLRPSTTVFELSTKYNLDISLFERMLNNNLNCYKLKVQHRMRPEICDLIVGTIYTELENNDSVRHYPAVYGTTKSLFFIAHKQLEQSESDSMSKSNLHEAKFMANFCRYLVQQGYSTNRITILTTYTGQMFLLKKEVGAFETCRGVRVTVVDNFQGEENDIILLSLVRSNEGEQIGFLKTDNRICVAISRAKHGLFISGNLDLLASKSPTWKQIREKLNGRDECGQKLELRCQIHNILTEVENAKDFSQVPEGGCNQMCDTELSCGHSCKSVCHIQDRTHTEYKCRLPCEKCCNNRHRCLSMCSQSCPPCIVFMDKTLPCLHVKKLKCHAPESLVTCIVQVEKQLSCGHVAEMACFKNPAEFSCKIKVTKTLPCLHEKTDVECHLDAMSITCKVVVSKKLGCGHDQEARCHIKSEMIKCETTVQKYFPDCKHKMDIKCKDSKNPKLYCKLSCTDRLSCGHACTKSCHLLDDPNHLDYQCRKNCERVCVNEHRCKSKHKCFQSCPPCFESTEKTLNCGIHSHKTKVQCWVDVTDANCEFPCELKLPLCEHVCQNLCFQPCGLCLVTVKKMSPCGHLQEIECSILASQDRCNVLVKPRFGSACNHDTRVPCRVQNTILPQDTVKYCQEMCTFRFESTRGKEGCDHTCKGTCSECHQGRLHKKCQEKCGKPLVCGHVCTFPCSKTCPPCQKKCDMECDHSKCKKLCGEPCTGCNEKCTWKCEHKKCTKLCREPCDRTFCEKPCPKKIKCGHDCVGFCGEPCPILCRICDKNELTEMFFGDEDDDNARFIHLEDCKHCFESTGFYKYMHQPVEKRSIKTQVCPRCSTIIRHSRRYGDFLRSQLMDVMNVKKILFGNQLKIKEHQQNVIQELERNSYTWKIIFPNVRNFILDKIAHVVRANPHSLNGPKTDRLVNKQVDEFTMASIELITNHGKDAINVIQEYDTGDFIELKGELSAKLIQRYNGLFGTLMNRELPLSDTEVTDFDREFERLFDLKQVYMRESHSRFTNGHSIAGPLYEQATSLIFSPKVYTKGIRDNIREILKGIDEALKTGLGISDREKREILSSFGSGFAQGHWFKCPNGHPYVITECGGAMEESRCNECGLAIGGGNHLLRSDNDLATEMDGAVEPLYPNMLMH